MPANRALASGVVTEAMNGSPAARSRAPNTRPSPVPLRRRIIHHPSVFVPFSPEDFPRLRARLFSGRKRCQWEGSYRRDRVP